MGFSPESSGLSLNGVTASEPTTTPASVLDRVGEVDRLLSLELSESLRADTGSSLAQVVSHWESLVSAGVRTPCGLHDALSQHFEAAVARVAAQASAHERLELLTRVLLGPAATGDLVERVSAIVEPIISKHPNQEASREHEATAAVVASLTRDPTTTGYRLLKVFALEVVRSPFRSLANMGLIPSASSFPDWLAGDGAVVVDRALDSVLTGVNDGASPLVARYESFGVRHPLRGHLQTLFLGIKKNGCPPAAYDLVERGCLFPVLVDALREELSLTLNIEAGQLIDLVLRHVPAMAEQVGRRATKGPSRTRLGLDFSPLLVGQVVVARHCSCGANTTSAICPRCGRETQQLQRTLAKNRILNLADERMEWSRQHWGTCAGCSTRIPVRLLDPDGGTLRCTSSCEHPTTEPHVLVEFQGLGAGSPNLLGKCQACTCANCSAIPLRLDEDMRFERVDKCQLCGTTDPLVRNDRYTRRGEFVPQFDTAWEARGIPTTRRSERSRPGARRRVEGEWSERDAPEGLEDDS